MFVDVFEVRTPVDSTPPPARNGPWCWGLVRFCGIKVPEIHRDTEMVGLLGGDKIDADGYADGGGTWLLVWGGLDGMEGRKARDLPPSPSNPPPPPGFLLPPDSPHLGW